MKRLKKKKNQNRPTTMKDLKAMERRADKKRDEAASYATLIVQGLWCMATMNVLNIGVDEIKAIYEEENRISDLITSGQYTLDELEQDLAERNVSFVH